MQNEYLSDKQVGDRFAVSRATVRRWARNDPTFPKPMKFSGGCTRWRLADLEAWEAAQAEKSAA